MDVSGEIRDIAEVPAVEIINTTAVHLMSAAAGGQDGAAKALAILKDELRRTMSYVGCPTIGEINGDVLWEG
jgi:isopentenyl diphosphate isomerase/L-lactate dehydrogenase-like FMN-dependent dehydrogenase